MKDYSANGRAPYFRERRKTGKKQFNVEIPEELYDSLQDKLDYEKKNKTLWLKEQIEEYLAK